MSSIKEILNIKDVENVINYSRELENDLEFKHQTLLEMDQYIENLNIPNSNHRLNLNKLKENQLNINKKVEKLKRI